MIQENLDIYFLDFGIAATLGQSVVINVIFDREYSPLSSIGAEGREIIVTVKSSDCENVKHGDLITVNSRAYEIVGIHPIMDGQITELELAE